jgi:hypothetical protein
MGLTWLPFKPDGPAEENSMASSFYRSWWQEMGAISRGMMFVEGNIATPLSLQDNGRQARKPASEEQRPDVSGLKKTADRLYQDFLLLGGRPVTPGHNDDINEPFPLLFAEERSPTTRPRPHQRKTQQSQTCATC